MRALLGRLAARISRVGAPMRAGDAPLVFPAANDSNASEPSLESLPVAKRGGHFAFKTTSWGRAVAEGQKRETPHPQSIRAFNQLRDARIGGLLWAERRTARDRSLHIMAGARLLAVFNSSNRQVYLRPDITAYDLAHMHSRDMPAGAAGKPADFVDCSIWDLLWQYGLFDPEALTHLPTSMATEKLKLGRLPVISNPLKQARQLKVVSCLLKTELSFEELLLASGVPADELVHDLAALFFTRALKTTGTKRQGLF